MSVVSPGAPCIAALVFFVLSISTPVFADTDSARDAATVRACERLIADYAYFRDREEAEPYAAVFAPNGVFEFRGTRFEGRHAIAARLTDGAGKVITRHVMSNVRIEPVSAAEAIGTSLVTLYQADLGDLPRTVDGFLGIGEYHDRFVLTDDGWRIAHRKFVDVFVGRN